MFAMIGKAYKNNYEVRVNFSLKVQHHCLIHIENVLRSVPLTSCREFFLPVINSGCVNIAFFVSHCSKPYVASVSVPIVELYYINSFYLDKKLSFRWHLYLSYQLYYTKISKQTKDMGPHFLLDRGWQNWNRILAGLIGLNCIYTGPHLGLGARFSPSYSE